MATRWRTLEGTAPRVLAHRGASGLMPEHTLGAYQLALVQGADVVEPDLVPSADGVLFARHDAGLKRSTDIARRAAYAPRAEQGDWPCDRFQASEIDGLGAIQPVAGRPASFDGKWAPPRWPAVLEWAREEASRRARTIVLYPELKHPALFQSRGLDIVALFAQSVAVATPGVEIWVQCFDAQALRRVHEATGLRCCLGVDRNGDWRALIAAHGAWLGGLVADKQLLRGLDGLETGLVDAAHAAGLRVDAWTFRDDQLGRGHADIREELMAAIETGVDGLFCDFPGSARAVVDRLAGN
jgi:glycerophosphoryl diester phosphodiesterase